MESSRHVTDTPTNEQWEVPADTRIRFFQDYMQVWQDSTQSSKPDQLYHYTNADGILGIIESRVIRATHIDCLNDASEGRYAHALLTEELLRRRHQLLATVRENPKNPHARAVLAFNERLQELVPHALGELGGYVACFCEHGNLLSQWRAYGPQGGYALGFPFQTLAFVHRPGIVSLERVVYDLATQRRIISDVLDCADTHLAGQVAAGLTESQLRAVADEAASDMWSFTFAALVAFKDPAFSEEREWRLTVHQPWPSAERLRLRPRFRARQNRVVPFVDVDLSVKQRLPLRSLRLGPGHDAAAATTLGLLLSAHGLHDVPVIASDIPLR